MEQAGGEPSFDLTLSGEGQTCELGEPVVVRSMPTGRRRRSRDMLSEPEVDPVIVTGMLGVGVSPNPILLHQHAERLHVVGGSLPDPELAQECVAPHLPRALRTLLDGL